MLCETVTESVTHGIRYSYAATAVLVIPSVVFANPLPDVAGVIFVDARNASSKSFGVSIVGLFLIWWAAQ